MVSAVPPGGFLVEVLASPGVVSEFIPATLPMVEVATYPPVGGGYDRFEVLQYTQQGPLTVSGAGTEAPIFGGNFSVDSIGARITTPSTGSPVILDVLKNNVSIYGNPANRPTFQPGVNIAAVGTFNPTTLVNGDFLEVIVAAVGSTTPGDTVVASIRLRRTS